ncbi:hypothetical protein PhaeoP128_00146 [Phaeobacter gallaeciensis]|nr:hypothetical protein PhaeoP129_00146 [Phaeobacter gallaeciensis]ATF20925.1 hypothetical protein PhaeoP128_00146 [Phaeobacter gallaeciensis]
MSTRELNLLTHAEQWQLAYSKLSRSRKNLLSECLEDHCSSVSLHIRLKSEPWKICFNHAMINAVPGNQPMRCNNGHTANALIFFDKSGARGAVLNLV